MSPLTPLDLLLNLVTVMGLVLAAVIFTWGLCPARSPLEDLR